MLVAKATVYIELKQGGGGGEREGEEGRGRGEGKHCEPSSAQPSGLT